MSGKRKGVLALAVVAVAVAVGGCGAVPTAQPASSATGDRTSLTASERATLLAGDAVEHPMAFDRDGAHYVGGVSYQLVAAPPSVVMQALEDVGSLPSVLPRTKSARVVEARGSRARVELVQGNSLVEARYTVRVERHGAREIRFRLDPSRRHDIDDVWGWFRAEPFDGGRTLVTVAVALDLGPGLARLLFEDRIQRVILSTPGHIKAFVEPMALASAQR